MATASQVRIDSEFESLCPPLTPEERSLLELSLATEGCKYPLTVWRGLLVDGHNRFDFCKSEGMDFDTEELEAGSREEVIEWIIKNQLGRRNCSEEQKSYLRGKRYASEKKAQAGTGSNQHKQSGHNVHSAKTAEKLSEEYGVDEKTIRRDASFATAVDKLAENVGPEIKSEILSGASPLTKKQIVAIAELPPKQQAKAVKEQVAPSPEKPKAFDYDAACIRVMEVGRKIIDAWPEEYRQQLSQWFKQLSKEALIITKED